MSFQKTDKEVLTKNVYLIICSIIILSMFFPFISVGIDMDISFLGGNTASASITGFQAMVDGYSGGIMLIALPLIIILTDYVSALMKFKKYIFIIAPIVSILILVFVIPAQAEASTSAADVSVKIYIERHVGF